LPGADAPLVNVFSMPGLIFVVAIYTFPYVFIMIANTLELIASELEDAASILGAGRLRVALTVTLPMVLPAIASGFILAVLQALALFGSPAILALPAGFHTITTQIWALFHYPPKVEMAAAFSVPLLLATALLLLVQKQLLGRRGYAAIGGKGGERRRIPLGPWRPPSSPESFWRSRSSSRIRARRSSSTAVSGSSSSRTSRRRCPWATRSPTPPSRASIRSSRKQGGSSAPAVCGCSARSRRRWPGAGSSPRGASSSSA